jgi:hypothetical protein
LIFLGVFQKPDWMIGKFKSVPNAILNLNHFHQNLCKRKSQLYTPPNGGNGWLSCFLIFRKGSLDRLEYYERKFQVDEETFMTNEVLTDICANKHFHIALAIFEMRSIENGHQFELVGWLNPDGKRKMAVLQYGPYPAWMIPDAKGELKLLDLRFCNKCSKYYNQKTFRVHQQLCYICPCGARQLRTDGHELICNKPHWNQKKRAQLKKDPEKAKVYEKAKGVVYDAFNHYADFEAFPDPESRKYIICMAGIRTAFMHQFSEKEVRVFEGRNTMDQFLKFLMELKGTLWFFYGARFDAHFVLKFCLENAYPINTESLLFTGTNLLSFKIKTNVGSLTIKDMWRFTPDSLDKTCKAYQIPLEFSKTSFRFEKVKNWDDFDEHKDEMRDYIKQDVLAMAHVFGKYSETCFKEYGCIASKFMTRSHFTYGIWSTICKPNLMAKLYKTPLEFMDYTRQFYRGGRVFCGRPAWQSQQWLDLCKGHNPGKFPILVSQKQYDAIDDFLVYTDVNSLYPSVMVNVDYPIEKFTFINFDAQPNHLQERIHLLSLKNQEACWKLWAAEVSVKCPNNLNVPFLMERNEKNEVHQTLLPKRAWWTGPELLEAVELGYIIERVHMVMKWPEGGDLFTEFITRTYEKKCNSPKDSPIYMVNKQFMNDLTGLLFFLLIP